jgi:hypothetical protein
MVSIQHRLIALFMSLMLGLAAMPASAEDMTGRPDQQSSQRLGHVWRCRTGPSPAAGRHLVGTGLFVVTLPFSALGGNVKETADTLVVGLAKSTFTRCMGCTETQDKWKNCPRRRRVSLFRHKKTRRGGFFYVCSPCAIRRLNFSSNASADSSCAASLGMQSTGQSAHALRLIKVPHTFRTAIRIDHIDVGPHGDSLIGARRFAHIAIDAFVSDLERHESIAPALHGLFRQLLTESICHLLRHKLRHIPPSTAISRTSVDEMNDRCSAGVRKTVSKSGMSWRFMLAN